VAEKLAKKETSKTEKWNISTAKRRSRQIVMEVAKKDLGIVLSGRTPFDVVCE